MHNAIWRRFACLVCGIAALHFVAGASELRLKSGRALNGEVKYVTGQTVVFQTNNRQMLFVPTHMVDMTREEWLEKARVSFEKEELVHAEGLCRQSLVLSPDFEDALALLKEIEKARFEQRRRRSTETPLPLAREGLDFSFEETNESDLLENIPPDRSLAEAESPEPEEDASGFAESAPETPMFGFSESAAPFAPAAPPAPVAGSSGEPATLPPFLPVPPPFGLLVNLAYSAGMQLGDPSDTQDAWDASPALNLNSDAHVRAAVSRAQADMRSIAVALEAYKVDHSAYPPALTPHLTSPIPYISRIPLDPFSTEQRPFQYLTDGARWVVWGIGPDQIDNHAQIVYDPTNGTRSAGDVMRFVQ